MPIDMLYDFISVSKFGLNKPPFNLYLSISNFLDDKILQYQYNTTQINDLPKKISDFLYIKLNNSQFQKFHNYVIPFTTDEELHFEINLHNNTEHIYKQYLTCKISEIYQNIN